LSTTSRLPSATEQCLKPVDLPGRAYRRVYLPG
jgi:hypothetical protein